MCKIGRKQCGWAGIRNTIKKIRTLNSRKTLTYQQKRGNGTHETHGAVEERGIKSEKSLKKGVDILVGVVYNSGALRG